MLECERRAYHVSCLLLYTSRIASILQWDKSLRSAVEQQVLLDPSTCHRLIKVDLVVFRVSREYNKKVVVPLEPTAVHWNVECDRPR